MRGLGKCEEELLTLPDLQVFRHAFKITLLSLIEYEKYVHKSRMFCTGLCPSLREFF